MPKAATPTKTLQKAPTSITHSCDDGIIVLDKVTAKKVKIIQLAVEDTAGDKVVVHFTEGDFSSWLRKAAKV